jgi:hypothetical protein
MPAAADAARECLVVGITRSANGLRQLMFEIQCHYSSK